MNFLLASSPVNIAAPPSQTPLGGVRCLPSKCSLRHAIDKASVLELDQSSLSRSAGDVATLGSPANRKAEPAVVGAVVAPSDFEEDGTGLATQREVGWAVQHPPVKSHMRCVEPFIPSRPLRHEHPLGGSEPRP